MFMLRALRWPDDRESLMTLDTSYTTDRAYRLEQTGRSFSLKEIVISPPLSKSYRLLDDLDTLSNLDWAEVAEDENKIVGLIGMKIEEWNRRANLNHLYVNASSRGLGVGRAMVEAALSEALHRNARCLWVETQSTNCGAIQFYERMGFAWCGLDTQLYDKSKVGEDEIALFFSRALE